MRVFPEYSGPMNSWPSVEVVEGMPEAIADVRHDALVCLATNAEDSGREAIQSALDRVGLGTVFDAIFCYEVLGFRKPSAEFFQGILDLVDVAPANVFMVGDDYEVDVLGANAVGIPAVWLNPITAETRTGALHVTAHSARSLAAALEILGLHRFGQ